MGLVPWSRRKVVQADMPSPVEAEPELSLEQRREAIQAEASRVARRLSNLRERVAELREEDQRLLAAIRRRDLAAELTRQADDVDHKVAAVVAEREQLQAEEDDLVTKLSPVAAQRDAVPGRRAQLEAKLAAGAASRATLGNAVKMQAELASLDEVQARFAQVALPLESRLGVVRERLHYLAQHQAQLEDQAKHLRWSAEHDPAGDGQEVEPVQRQPFDRLPYDMGLQRAGWEAQRRRRDEEDRAKRAASGIVTGTVSGQRVAIHRG